MPEPRMVIYRSADPGVLAHWGERIQARAEWRTAVFALRDELGFTDAKAWLTDRRLTGFVYAGEPPTGWRRDRRRTSVIVPARRTPEGRALAKRLDALVQPSLRQDLPGGMPEVAMSAAAMAFMWPGAERHCDAVYVDWSGPLEAGDAAHIDPQVWERIKLSAYYAAIEAEEEQAAT